MCLEHYVSVVRSFVAIFVPLAGLCVAIAGLSTWRRQLRGNTEYELARRLLRQAYSVRDSFDVVRDPSAYLPSEKEQSAEAGEAKDPHERAMRKEYDRRLAKLRTAWSALEAETLEAEVLWGQAVHEALKPLRTCTAELIATALEYFFVTYPRAGSQVDTSADRLERITKVVFKASSDPEKDAFLKRTAEAVKSLEDFVRPHLKP